MSWPVRPCSVKMVLSLTGCVLYFFWQLFTGKVLTMPITRPPLLFIISFDGFRWDYLEMVREAGHHTPVFDSLIADGVKAKWVKNSYVTLTLPNHYSIATGLYEENHGIVSNQMYDPVFNETFDGIHGQLAETKWWNNGSDTWLGEPVWLANQQKFSHHSGVYFWAGSEAAINGKHARYYEHYNWSVSYTKRIDTIVKWLTLEKDPINLAMLYFEDPDFTGHKVGPESLEMIERIMELDEILGYAIDSIKEQGLFSNMNLIVTSDHGMTRLLDTIYLDDYVPHSINYSTYGRPPVLHILPAHGNQQVDLYRSLEKVPHVHVYMKDEIPQEYHYRYNRRVLDIIVEAQEGYLVCMDKASCVQQSNNKGDHGYSNNLDSMHPIFIAHGPAFKRGYLSEPFDIVDIYPLTCHILGVQPGLHDGNFENIKHILTDDGRESFESPGRRWALMTFLGSVASIVLFLVGFYFLIKYSLTAKAQRQEEHLMQPTRESQLLLSKHLAEDMV